MDNQGGDQPALPGTTLDLCRWSDGKALDDSAKTYFFKCQLSDLAPFYHLFRHACNIFFNGLCDHASRPGNLAL